MLEFPWFLVLQDIDNNGAVVGLYGPFPSEDEAKWYAKAHFPYATFKAVKCTEP